MKYRMIFIMLLAGLSQPMTLKQFSILYKAGEYDMRHFGEFAADWKRSTVGWGLLDSQVWIPFPSQIYFNGKSTGTMNVSTQFLVTEGFCLPEWRRIQTDLITYFTPELIPSWPQPMEPNQPPPAIVPSTSIPDVNDIILQVEEISRQEPNNVPIKTLLNLLKAEREEE